MKRGRFATQAALSAANPSSGPPVVPGRSARPSEEPVAFEADHPFLFVIRDNASGLVVFMGRVTDPTQR